MRAQFKHLFRPYSLMKNADNTDAVLISIVESEGTMVTMEIQANSSFDLLEINQLKSSLDVYTQSVVNQDPSREIIRIQATPQAMIEVVKSFHTYFKSDLVHHFKLCLHDYLNSRKFMSSSYWEPKEIKSSTPLDVSSFSTEPLKTDGQSDQVDQVDPPGPSSNITEQLAACRKRRASLPDGEQVNQNLYFWHQAYGTTTHANPSPVTVTDIASPNISFS